MSQDETERTLPLSEAGHIDSLREQFSGAWKSGANPRLEEFLCQVDADARHVAFREFLKIEVKLRRRRQEHVEADEYVGRFPAFEVVIHEVFSGSGDSSGRVVGGGSGLHVRCPNCGRPNELAPDAELESIRCGACGSDFSLTSNAGQATRDARGFARIGHFKLVERLGMGAFGTVWKAQDLDLDRTVAVKIPRAGQLSRQQEEFFLREARSAAQLRHPNIVPVHEVGRDEETLYIVSDFVRGVDLSEWLTGASPSAREAAKICTTIADALHHAHERGVVHRDLKPANVMIDGAGQPHLMDFGLARREAGESTMTLDGQIIGTPAYMSPEQATGEAHTADRRSDVYSLGVILFELLTGELPFRGSARMMMHQVIHDPPPSPRKLDSSVHKDLETITLKCLEKAPKRRYQTAGELSDELRRFLEGEPIAARPASKIERALRWAKRKPALATAGALVLFLAVAGPLAALRIELQRRRLAELVEEKNNLIAVRADDRKNDAGKIATLQRRLDEWEGRTNAGDIWPPAALDETRKELLADLYDARYDEVTAELQDKDVEPWQRACGHIGLAILADEIASGQRSVRHWRAASSILAHLMATDPENVNYALALADCQMQLAKHVSKVQSTEADDLLASAAELYESLSQDDAEDPMPRVGLFYAERARALERGYSEPVKQRLLTAYRSLSELRQRWTHDPVMIYKIANYLAQREPFLLKRHVVGD